MTDEYIAITRFADLDTQRHVTSRTYEQFALEGRYRILAKLGFDQERIQNERIYLEAVSGYSKFYRQQFPGARLRVTTQAFSCGEENIHWEQKIFEESGELVCHLQLKTRTTCAGAPFVFNEIGTLKDTEILYTDLPLWSGKSERIVSQYTMPYSERDFAGRYNVAALWRIFEEGRWMFAEKTGMTYDRIVELDTTSFYMGSICNYLAEVPAGRTLQIMTWIERVEKIRYYFRQDVLFNGRLLLAMRDEQLIVSLSKARPQRASEKFMQYIEKYLEQR